ncbi:hypothetical protein VOLCADRAFT_88709 [Volvox carteri f. nagariensis]|uniref:Uncharacterized protein n=1 Tax=Volvox carteri f. nagariensis TaxID=3068 RepID=D8TPR2_VOLCA|nr:uncharacterized protein VOLCADRAFT_88709 [Volvox carteri f. nagariensis]EFJ50660.1 hypothetical protein VOLCADRAFT_88709 [Volvox carteri f. nagariensis]|eukprot:XP_002948253.1 hypothetical protein VOLCADRAFT_88709 [Volvox carteri f. nagariensis]
MAPKLKVADLEAKLKAKEAELQAAQANLAKAEASRAKLKQYLEAFREQAVSTTQIITQYQQLQKDHSALQEKQEQLAQENERLRQAARAPLAAAAPPERAGKARQSSRGPPTEAPSVAPASAEPPAGSELAPQGLARLAQQLKEEQHRRQQLQESYVRLQQEQAAAVQESEQLRQERDLLLQQRTEQREREREGEQPQPAETWAGAGAGPALSTHQHHNDQHQQQWQRQQQQQQQNERAVQALLAQLEKQQQLNEDLRGQLDAVVRQQQDQKQQRQGGSAAGGTLVAASTVPAGPRVQPTAVKPGERGAPSTAFRGRQRREGGGGAASAPESAAGSVAIAGSDSSSSSDSGVEDTSSGAVGIAARRLQRRQQREHELQKQREHELQKQREHELQKQREHELQKQREHELQKQREHELQKQREREERLVQELTAAQSQRRAAEAALEAARRELCELQRSEAAQRGAMEHLQAQLQALQALVSEHATALKRQSAHLQRHDSQLGHHATELERHGDELRRHDGELAAAGEAASRQAAALERLQVAHEGDTAAVRGLTARLEAAVTGEEALRGRLQGMAIKMQEMHRTHSILRHAFGGGGGGDVEEGDGYGYGYGRGGWTLGEELPGRPPRGGKVSPTALPSPRQRPQQQRQQSRLCVGTQHDRLEVLVRSRSATALEQELLPLPCGEREVEVGDGETAAAQGWASPEGPSEDERMEDGGGGGEVEEQLDGHRDKRRRLEGPAAAAAVTAAAPKGNGVWELQRQQQPTRPIAAGERQLLPIIVGQQGPTAAEAPVQKDPLTADLPARGEGRQRVFTAAAAAAAGGPSADGAGEALQRRGRGRPRKERTPGELLATLLDGKATGTGQLAKVAAAAARRAAAAVRGHAVHPAPLATAVCNAILRCSRGKIGVPTPPVLNTDSGTAMAAAAVATSELTQVAGRTQKVGPDEGAGKARGSAAAVGAAVAGGSGFLAVVLPTTGRSRGHGGSGSGGAVTLLDALSGLWCKPAEQQRQVVRWLLQVVRDTDCLLGGNTAGAQSDCLSDGVAAPHEAPPHEAPPRPVSLHTVAAEECVDEVDAAGTKTEDLAAAAAAAEAVAVGEMPVGMQPASGRALGVSPPAATAASAPRPPGPVGLVGGLVARKLMSAVVACDPLDSCGQMNTSAAGTAAEGTPAGGGGGRGGAVGPVEVLGQEAPAMEGTAMHGPDLPERCAAAHALGQLFRLYQDREAFQCTALELLHAAAEARSCSAAVNPNPNTSSLNHSQQLAHSVGHEMYGGLRLAPSATPTPTPTPTSDSHSGGSSLIPLACLLVGWSQALMPVAVTMPPPDRMQVTAAAAAATAPRVTESALPRPVQAGAAVKLPPGITAAAAAAFPGSFGPVTSHDIAVPGGGTDRSVAELHGTTNGNLFCDSESEMDFDMELDVDLDPNPIRSCHHDEACMWSDPVREAQLVSEPLVVAMTTCAQLLALERLAFCCCLSADGGGDGGSSAGGGDGSDCANLLGCGSAKPLGGVRVGPPPVVPEANTANTVGSSAATPPAHGSPLGGFGHSLFAGLDCQAEAVAAAALLRAAWEQQQQQQAAQAGTEGKYSAVATLVTHGSETGAAAFAGPVLPGVAEVLIAAGVVKATMGKGYATKFSTGLATDTAAAANGGGSRKPGGEKGSGSHDSSGGGDGGPHAKDLDAALAAALARARAAVLALAARLMGLLLVVVTDRQRVRKPGLVHGEPPPPLPPLTEQLLHCPGDGTGDGGRISPAAAQASPNLAGQSRPGASEPLPSTGDAEPDTAYLAGLRQALLLTCHLLPYDVVYDRVLRQLVSWLSPGGPAAVDAGGSWLSYQRRRASAESIGAGETAAAAAAGDTAASAAGSPVEQPNGCEAPEAPSHGPAGPVTAPQGAPVVDDEDPAVLVDELVVPSGSPHIPDLPLTRLLLELIQDVACQALGSAPAIVGKPRPSAHRHAPTAACRPSSSGPPGPAAAVLRAACASLCEELASLVPTLLTPPGHRGVGDPENVEVRGVGGLQHHPQEHVPTAARQPGGEAGNCPGVGVAPLGAASPGPGTDQARTAAAAALLSVVFRVAGMCVSGLASEPEAAARGAGGGRDDDGGVDAGAGGLAGEGLCFAVASVAAGTAGRRVLRSRAAGAPSTDGVVAEVKTRVGRALSTLRQGLRQGLQGDLCGLGVRMLGQGGRGGAAASLLQLVPADEECLLARLLAPAEPLAGEAR